MNLLHLVFVAAIIACAHTLTAQPARESVGSADTAYAEFQAFSKAELMRDMTYTSQLDGPRVSRLQSAYGDLVCESGERFLAKYPDDARRVKVMSGMLSARREFTGPDAENRSAAWNRRRAELRAQVLAVQNVETDTVGPALASEVTDSIGGRGNRRDLDRAERALDQLATRLPTYAQREWLESYFLQAQKRANPAAYEARVRKLAADPNPDVAAMAQIKVGAFERKKRPLDLKFADLDGREIDLAKYRGKVVLLDFWATWCVPCMKEMPNLKAVYQKYHDIGFEIIGITDDTLADDPVNPKKGHFTIETMKAFLATEGMVWPQFWDNRPRARRGPKLLLQQFDVGSLPTAMLFDQEGRFVTSDNHGAKLEANVRRLLKL